MRIVFLVASIAVMTNSNAQAGPAVVLGLMAAGAVGMSIAATQQPATGDAVSTVEEDEAWDYTTKHGWVGGTARDVSTIETPLAPRPGTSPRVVSACRDAIAKTAGSYDVASLEAVSAGRQSRKKGRTVAQIEVRAVYRVRGVHEVKRTVVRCEIDRSGRVIATS